jgi:broad specificity phosphatase PhoE
LKPSRPYLDQSFIAPGDSHLSNIYLVRHGQAGTRDAYDSLSGLGQQQSLLLGEYFLANRLEFSVVYAGSMERQLQTAFGVKHVYDQAGVSFPIVTVDEQWNEFDLTDIYRELGPKLCEIDEEFRLEYEQMRLEVKQNIGVSDAKVHRHWRSCDTKMVDAWISGTFGYSGETWQQFRARIGTTILKLANVPPRSNVLVSSSATPTGVLIGLALGLADERIRELAGMLYNSSYTTLRWRNGRMQLFQFNAVPHLPTPELRTFR